MRNPLFLCWRDREGGRPSPATMVGANLSITEEELSVDVPGAVGEINRLKGSITELKNDDLQICTLVAFVCEALCKANPGMRDRFIAELADRMHEQFPDQSATFRARTLHYGLGLAMRRVEP